MALTDKLTAIANVIREKSGTPELIPLAEMPGKIEVVYDVGYWNGHTDGFNEGHEAGYEGGLADGYESGKQEEHDRFWDSCQDKGARTYYQSAFNGNYGWDKYNFYPKYDIVPVGNATQMFYAWEKGEKHQGLDLAQRLEECGVVLDTSQCTNLYLAFAYSRFSRLPAIDVRGITTTNTTSTNLFANTHGWLKTIDKIIMDETTTPVSSWFTNSAGIENLTIEGTIGQNGFNVSPCTALTPDSLMSIINALKTLPEETTKTVTLGTTNLGKLSDEQKAIATTQKGWTLA